MNNRAPVTRLQLGQPISYIANVTPEMALEWLERNTHNRHVRPAQVAALARAINAGQWKLDGNPIRFASDGTLLDGQHRLWAVAETGKTVQMFVVEGLENDAQDVMDTGAKRSTSDALTLAGRPNGSRLAAAARLALTMSTDGKVTVFANSEVLAWLNEHEEMEKYVAYTRNLHAATGLKPSVFDYTYWRLALIDSDAATEFFNRLSDGVGLPPASPILALKRRLSGAYGKDRKISTTEQIAGTFRAWNAFRSGESLHRLITLTRQGELQIPEPK